MSRERERERKGTELDRTATVCLPPVVSVCAGKQTERERERM